MKSEKKDRIFKKNFPLIKLDWNAVEEEVIDGENLKSLTALGVIRRGKYKMGNVRQ